jgi:hypothetical protein
MNLGSLSVPDPDEGWIYLDAVLLIKCLDDNGNIRYREMKSPNLTSIEALGMATTYIDTLRANIMRAATND